ncbi:MAG: DUF4091 domain-containing protein, partial [Candidatus Hydrogenedentes bacterium]|nr:DUF4091 domain-containing protein [Candidatus Hydrogenedentota bacterium]
KVYSEDAFEAIQGEVPEAGLCRGEYEPFQIVIRSSKDCGGVTVSATGLPRGVTLECQPVGLVDIKVSKVRAGLTPDPLHNEPRFDITAGRPQSFWITLHAAGDAETGPFDLACRVLAGEEELAAFTLPARVYDFPMPLRPHLASMVEFRPWNDKGYYKDEDGRRLSEWPVDRQARVYRAFYRWYHRNRMQPGSVFPRLNISKGDDGTYGFSNGDAVNQCAQEFFKEFPGTFDVMWIQRLMGYTTHFPAPDSDEGREKIEYIREYVRLYVEFAKAHDWPLERIVWYAGDEPICPHARRDPKSKEGPIEALNACVSAVRPVLDGVPVFVSAWPFDRELLAAVDIWAGRPYGEGSIMPRMELIEAANYGKAVAITTDNSNNILMDRQAINYRMDPLQAWYADVRMIEHWSNMYWPKTPWTPSPAWFSDTFVVPGDGNLCYPPAREDEVVSSIRAELMREGMEDYEYLWLLRHASYVIRGSASAGDETELLRRIDSLLWDFRHWIIRSMGRDDATEYIGICCNIPSERIRTAGDELDQLRAKMQGALEEAHQKGYFDEDVIDAGQPPIRTWFRHD